MKIILKNFILCCFLILIFTSILQAENVILRVVKEEACLRLYRSVESEKIATFPPGTILESTSKVDGWYKVELESEDGLLILGYIQEEFVDVLGRIKDEPKTEEKVEVEPEPQEIREELPPPLAENHLRGLSVRAKSKRIWRGVENIAYGGLFGGLGIALHSIAEGDPEGEKVGNYFLVFGALNLATGVMDVIMRSGVEEEYDAAMKLDPLEREQACAAALASEAHKGKVGRIISGSIGLGVAAYFIAVQPIKYRGFSEVSDNFNWNYACAGIGVITAIFSFTGKTIEERHYQKYLLEKGNYGRPSEIGFNFGFVPRGVAFTLTYNF